jgi:hypothetical protein
MSVDRAWRDLAGRLGPDDDRAAAVATFLIVPDSGVARNHHGLGHVARMLDAAEAVSLADREAVGPAILSVVLHDARRAALRDMTAPGPDTGFGVSVQGVTRRCLLREDLRVEHPG